MKKPLHYVFFFLFFGITIQAQKGSYWERFENTNVVKTKTAMRLSFPENYKLFKTSINFLQVLQNAPNRLNSTATSVEIILPNLDGNLEHYQVFEFSNFDPLLQSQYPNIRSYIGVGLEDKNAQVRFSVDPSGLQAMVFRVGKPNEFIEVFSADKSVYAVHESSRKKGEMPFICATEDKAIFKTLENKTTDLQNKSSAGQLLNFRLAMSCTGEYTNYFGGTVAGSLAAINATMTRVNGVFEKDFAIHMNLISNNASIIFSDPTTDPYSSLGNWNGELQTTLTNVIGEANYDVGHLFGSTGGGGNAGCIGCVCVDGIKGRGITSPSDGVPAGDTFDIDYVAHELGHQFGGNHTFSHSLEGSGVNVEPGSGSTIMGYAGITSRDVQQNSDAYFVYASIKQVQDNMVGKTCPIRVNLGNIAPVINAGLDLTIPSSTPFVITGTTTSTNSNLTYCWEQNDTATSQSGAQSGASITKTGGPNFRSYNPVVSPTRYFPRLQSVLANSNTTQGLEILTEALNSNARTMKFVLTARDNFAGSGQTGSDEMVVTVTNLAGPFVVTAPNLNTDSWAVGSNQSVTWNVAGTTTNNINAEFVDIFLSNDGGFTYPTLLASKVPNDGSEIITVPNSVGSNNRIMVKGYKHIFYDISNSNFTITTPTTNFAVGYNGVADQQNKETCAGVIPVVFNFLYTTYNNFSSATNFTVTGLPTNAVGSFSQSSATANATVSLSVVTNNVTPGFYAIVINATSGTSVVNTPFYLRVFSAGFATVSLTSPVNLATAQPVNLNLTWQAEPNASSYDIQISTDQNFANNVQNFVVSGTNLGVTNLSEVTSYYWRVKPKNTACTGTFGSNYKFTTGQVVCNNYASANVPIVIPTTANAIVNSTLTVTDTSTISDINVSVNIQHTWVNDMTITLISPAGTEVQLVVRPCSSSPLNDIIATFDDSGSPIVCGNNPAITGTVKSTQLLSAFNGQTANGVWTLRVLDSFAQDGGAINGWTLNVCSTQAPLGVANNTFQDLSIFPNPSKDQITIQFQSQSEEAIDVAIYDLRGRQVSASKFSNTGNFSETISLAKFESGVYLVKIQDGQYVVTKRIIKE
jgi:subtilisin-like proprotein convertase family protein